MTRSYKSIRSGGTLSAGMSDRLTWLNFDFLLKTYELNWYTFERKKWYTLQWKHWYTMHRNIQVLLETFGAEDWNEFDLAIEMFKKNWTKD